MVALFGCSYTYETIIVCIVFEYRALEFVHETFDLGEFRSSIIFYSVLIGIVVCFLHWVFTNRDQRGFVNAENMRGYLTEF